tara:strand:- start:91 stop:978 length:888 start_codon:yes stop_codon:yes gene_type:complete
MSFTATPAKQKVRDIITKEVDLMNQTLDNVSFATLTDKDTTHEQAISDLGVDSILCINKNKDIIHWIKCDFEDHGSCLYQARAIKSDINKWVQMTPKHINSFIWFDFCGLASPWGDFFDGIHHSRFCENSKIAVTFCASTRGSGNWLDDLKKELSEDQLEKLNSTDTLSTKIFAQILMDHLCDRLQHEQFRCTQAIAYTSMGGTMFTLVFSHSLDMHGYEIAERTTELTYIENNPVLKLSPDVSELNAIKIYQYAQTELNLKAKDLTHIANTYLNGYGKLAHLTRKSQGATVSTK